VSKRFSEVFACWNGRLLTRGYHIGSKNLSQVRLFCFVDGTFVASAMYIGKGILP